MAVVIGHRGARAVAPENTLLAIRAGVQAGADFVEVDVRLSSDGTPVLMHDETVDRTTNGKGRVEELSLQDLSRLDAGCGEPVPTLHEAAELACDLGAGIIVEMKEEWIEELIVDSLKAAGGRSIVTSFYHRSLLEVKSLGGPDTGIIISSLPMHPVQLALWAEANSIFPARFDANLFKQAHKKGISVYPWTVNDSAKAAWLMKLGADGLVTDDPGRIGESVRTPPKDTGRGNCEYYPCHFPGQDCTHCFCPLYPCKDEELGRWVRTKRKKRVWTCINCDLVHRPEAAEHLSANPGTSTKQLKELFLRDTKCKG